MNPDAKEFHEKYRVRNQRIRDKFGKPTLCEACLYPFRFPNAVYVDETRGYICRGCKASDDIRIGNILTPGYDGQREHPKELRARKRQHDVAMRRTVDNIKYGVPTT